MILAIPETSKTFSRVKLYVFIGSVQAYKRSKRSFFQKKSNLQRNNQKNGGRRSPGGYPFNVNGIIARYF